MIYQGLEGYSRDPRFFTEIYSGIRKNAKFLDGIRDLTTSLKAEFAKSLHGMRYWDIRMRASLEQECECGVIRTPLPDHDSSCLDCTTLNFHFKESSLTSPFLAGSGLQSFTSCTADSKDEWEIPRDVLIIGHKIGEGQFGLVLEGTLMTGKYGEEVRRQETLL